jgi:hypothetical protein
MYQKYVIWVMRLVVDACYGGGVMQRKAGLITPW